MSQGNTIASTFDANLWIIKRQTDGLSNADSLLRPSFRANCLNWVLGHIVVGRNRALVLLGLEPVWGDDERQVYETGSAPLLDDPVAVPLERLLVLLDLAQKRLTQLGPAPVPEAGAHEWIVRTTHRPTPASASTLARRKTDEPSGMK